MKIYEIFHSYVISLAPTIDKLSVSQIQFGRRKYSQLQQDMKIEGEGEEERVTY
jgi:hypothetical protein